MGGIIKLLVMLLACALYVTIVIIALDKLSIIKKEVE